MDKANTYYDEKGAPDRVIGVHIDIKERKRAIEALEESERRFHMMSDSAPVMIWMTDIDNRCNFLNRTWLLFTGKTMNEETGEGWYEGIHPEDRAVVRNVFDEARKEEKEFKIDYRLKRYDGEYR